MIELFTFMDQRHQEVLEGLLETIRTNAPGLMINPATRYHALIDRFLENFEDYLITGEEEVLEHTFLDYWQAIGDKPEALSEFVRLPLRVVTHLRRSLARALADSEPEDALAAFNEQTGQLEKAGQEASAAFLEMVLQKKDPNNIIL